MRLRRAAFAIVSAGALALSGAPALSADLIVTIEALRAASGDVYVSLFDRAETWPEGKPLREEKRPAVVGDLTLVFTDLPPGRYAVAAYHDENGNGEFDTNLLGIPLEGFALSNNLRPVLSAPSFAAASFEVPDEGRAIAMKMRY